MNEFIRLGPLNSDAYNNRGGAYRGLGQYLERLQDLDEAIRLDPLNAYGSRGIVHTFLPR